MSLQDILSIEQSNTHHIHFYREGVFYKAYERSAYLFVMLVIAAICTLCGCSAEFEPEMPGGSPQQGEPVEVGIVFGGIADYATQAETRGSSNSRASEVLATAAAPIDKNRTLVVTIAQTPQGDAAPQTRATNVTGTTLRVVAYNSAGVYVDDCVYNVTNGVATAQGGQSLMVPVSTGNYTFYCFSPANAYNAGAKTVSVNPTDNFAIGAPVTALIKSTNRQQNVNIPVLAPKTARIRMSVTSPQGAVTCAGTITGNFTNAASTCNMTNGAMTYGGAANVGKAFASATDVFIIPAGNATGNLTLAFSSLTMGGIIAKIPNITLPTITPAPGNDYTVSVSVAYNTSWWVPLPSLGLKVAKGNLMRAAGTTGAWYLAPDQGWYSGNGFGGDYFCWGIEDPTSVNNSGGQNMNVLTAACVSLIGAGWRVPNNADNSKLVSSCVWGTYQSSRGTSNGCYFGTTTVPSTANQDSYCFLPAAGYRSNSGNMLTVGSYGYYWSSEPRGSTAACRLYFDSSSINATYNSSDRYYGQSVRCVADL